MSQTQQRQPHPGAVDRILHMSDNAAEVMPRIREWAKTEGIGDKLEKALDYCRTFSGGPEAEWKSHLHTDMFFNEEKPSFTCAVSARCEPVPESSHYEIREGLKSYMLIGMIWDNSQKDWSFHS